MARLFDDAIPHDIQIASAILSGAPISMACMFNSDDLASGDDLALLSISDISVNDHYFILQIDATVAGDPIRAAVDAGAGSAAAVSSTGATVSTWHHACAVFATATDRRAFIDGGSKGTNAVSRTPAGLDVSTIGSFRRAAGTAVPMSGLIAEVAIWNIAITDAEVAVLGEGYSPLLVRPQNLVFYAPLVRELLDRVGGVTLTNNGSTVGDHSRVLLPPPSLVLPPAPVVTAIASQRLKIGVGR